MSGWPRAQALDDEREASATVANVTADDVAEQEHGML